MKVTLSWLKEFIDTNATVEEITEALISLGIEVEEIDNYIEKYKNISVGYIKQVSQHPNADKLKVCQVETKEGELQVVCGASNAREGIYVIFAKIGTYIEALGITLQKANIRGVESNGMMLSEREMGISEEHEGIIELKQAKVGEPAANVLGLNDVVIDISITPNRGDVLGVIGIARELSAYGLGSLKKFNYENQTNISDDLLYGEKNNDIPVKLDNNISQAFYARKITVKENKKSPLWLQNRLKMIGLNPRNAIVDITNYMLFSYSQPMHAYDADKTGKVDLVSVDFANNKEKIVTLDKLDNELTDIVPVVKINNKISCIAGIKGTLSSAIDDNTTSILLEAAHFDPKIIAFAKRQLAINTDAAYRYERGTDKKNIEHVLNAATNMILDICGGKVEYTAYTDNTVSHSPLKFDIKLVNQLSGIDIPKDEILKILKKLDFEVTSEKEILVVTPPSYRNDIDVPETVVAEIIRLYGINKIQAAGILHDVSKNDIACSSDFMRQIIVRNLLAKSGGYETLNMSFISEQYANAFEINNKNLVLHNPISEDLKVMRNSLIPSLLLCASNNINKMLSNINIFEVASIYKEDSSQEACAAALLHGNKQNKNWLNGESSKYTIWDAKGILFSVINSLGFAADKLTISRNDLPSYYNTGRSATISIGKNIIGHFGIINPLALNTLKIEGEFIIFELYFNRLPMLSTKLKPSIKIPELPSIKRDFSFIIDEEVLAGEVIRVVHSAVRKYITNLEITDIYRGSNIGEGKKSISLQVVLQPTDKTFVEDEIKEFSNNIIIAMNKNFDAVLRDK